MNVVRLKQPLRKRFATWWRKNRLSRQERLGWCAVGMIVAALTIEASGHADRATFMLCIGIFLYLLARDDKP